MVLSRKKEHNTRGDKEVSVGDRFHVQEGYDSLIQRGDIEITEIFHYSGSGYEACNYHVIQGGKKMGHVYDIRTWAILNMEHHGALKRSK